LKSLIPELSIIRRNQNSGIEEGDIEVLNNNGRGIWKEFDSANKVPAITIDDML
jgi:hypothetical protein